MAVIHYDTVQQKLLRKMQRLTVPIVTLVKEHIIAHGILSYLTASTSKQMRAVDTNCGLYLQIAP